MGDPTGYPLMIWLAKVSVLIKEPGRDNLRDTQSTKIKGTRAKYLGRLQLYNA